MRTRNQLTGSAFRVPTSAFELDRAIPAGRAAAPDPLSPVRSHPADLALPMAEGPGASKAARMLLDTGRRWRGGLGLTHRRRGDGQRERSEDYGGDAHDLSV